MQKTLKFLSAALLLIHLRGRPAFQSPDPTAIVYGEPLGDPVVNITFGSGSNPGPALKAATTAYASTYTTSPCPADGNLYTLTNSSSVNCFSPAWHTVSSDHTGNPKGYFMLINASYQPSDFYLDTVHNLCGNTTYQFSAWVRNLLMVLNNPNCPPDEGILPNITFNIETTTGDTLGTYTTGDIPETSNTWSGYQYGLFFVTPGNVSDVVLRMTNNAVGGCGNDLALDDITFRACGPMVSASISGINGADSINVCEDDPSVFTFNAGISSGYTSPEFSLRNGR